MPSDSRSRASARMRSEDQCRSTSSPPAPSLRRRASPCPSPRAARPADDGAAGAGACSPSSSSFIGSGVCEQAAVVRADACGKGGGGTAVTTPTAKMLTARPMREARGKKPSDWWAVDRASTPLTRARFHPQDPPDSISRKAKRRARRPDDAPASASASLDTSADDAATEGLRGKKELDFASLSDARAPHPCTPPTDSNSEPRSPPPTAPKTLSQTRERGKSHPKNKKAKRKSSMTALLSEGEDAACGGGGAHAPALWPRAAVSGSSADGCGSLCESSTGARRRRRRSARLCQRNERRDEGVQEGTQGVHATQLASNPGLEFNKALPTSPELALALHSCPKNAPASSVSPCTTDAADATSPPCTSESLRARALAAVGGVRRHGRASGRSAVQSPLPKGPSRGRVGAASVATTATQPFLPAAAGRGSEPSPEARAWMTSGGCEVQAAAAPTAPGPAPTFCEGTAAASQAGRKGDAALGRSPCVSRQVLRGGVVDALGTCIVMETACAPSSCEEQGASPRSPAGQARGGSGGKEVHEQGLNRGRLFLRNERSSKGASLGCGLSKVLRGRVVKSAKARARDAAHPPGDGARVAGRETAPPRRARAGPAQESTDPGDENTSVDQVLFDAAKDGAPEKRSVVKHPIRLCGAAHPHTARGSSVSDEGAGLTSPLHPLPPSPPRSSPADQTLEDPEPDVAGCSNLQNQAAPQLSVDILRPFAGTPTTTDPARACAEWRPTSPAPDLASVDAASTISPVKTWGRTLLLEDGGVKCAATFLDHLDSVAEAQTPASGVPLAAGEGGQTAGLRSKEGALDPANTPTPPKMTLHQRTRSERASPPLGWLLGGARGEDDAPAEARRSSWVIEPQPGTELQPLMGWGFGPSLDLDAVGEMLAPDVREENGLEEGLSASSAMRMIQGFYDPTFTANMDYNGDVEGGGLVDDLPARASGACGAPPVTRDAGAASPTAAAALEGKHGLCRVELAETEIGSILRGDEPQAAGAEVETAERDVVECACREDGDLPCKSNEAQVCEPTRPLGAGDKEAGRRLSQDDGVEEDMGGEWPAPSQSSGREVIYRRDSKPDKPGASSTPKPGADAETTHGGAGSCETSDGPGAPEPAPDPIASSRRAGHGHARVLVFDPLAVSSSAPSCAARPQPKQQQGQQPQERQQQAHRQVDHQPQEQQPEPEHQLQAVQEHQQPEEEKKPDHQLQVVKEHQQQEEKQEEHRHRASAYKKSIASELAHRKRRSADGGDPCTSARPVKARKELAAEMARRVRHPAMWGLSLPKVPGFTILAKKGEGGYGVVYKALRHKAPYGVEECGLKFITPTLSNNRIMNEVRALAKLRGKPNVIELQQVMTLHTEAPAPSREGAAETSNVGPGAGGTLLPVLVFPFVEADDFRSLAQTADLGTIRQYMRALMAALRETHACGLIHRDVKASNFLFSKEQGNGWLIDFGLVEEVPKWELEANATRHDPAQPIKSGLARSHADASHKPARNPDAQGRKATKRVPPTRGAGPDYAPAPAPAPTSAHRDIGPAGATSRELASRGQVRAAGKDQATGPGRTSRVAQGAAPAPRTVAGAAALPPKGAASQRAHLGSNMSQSRRQALLQAAELQRGALDAAPAARAGSSRAPSLAPGPCPTFTGPGLAGAARVNAPRPPGRANSAQESKPALVSVDLRAVGQGAHGPVRGTGVAGGGARARRMWRTPDANRAGTRGFRAPEVLLRVHRQSTKIDVWSAGVLMASLVTGRYPFFDGGEEDPAALAEVALLCGKEPLQALAHANAMHIRELPVKPRVFPEPTSQAPYNISRTTRMLAKMCSSGRKLKPHKIPQDAWDLIDRCLTVDPERRISAEDALNHPFLLEGVCNRSKDGVE